MRLDIKDLAVGAATAANPMLGATAQLLRHRAPRDGNLVPNLGKSLSHHQVIPSVIQPRVPNTPRTDIGKVVLSMTGGNPRIVNQSVDGVRAKAVKQMSHFDRKQQLSKGLDALKLAPQAKSLLSL